MPPDSENRGLAVPNSDKLILRPEAQPTESYQEDSPYRTHLIDITMHRRADHKEPTGSDVLGPYFREEAPFRAKITQPHELGTSLVIKGRVWNYKTKEPAGLVKMDVWQADAAGNYDNSDLNDPPPANVFKNRARLSCDRDGYYEFETIHPGPYQIDEIWRAPHIHFLIKYPNYTTLITQLFFKGDPYQDQDPYIKQSLIIQLQKKENNGIKYEEGIFDIVLTPSD